MKDLTSMPVKFSDVDELLKDVFALGNILGMVREIFSRRVTPERDDIELIVAEAGRRASSYQTTVVNRIVLSHHLSHDVVEVLRGKAKGAVERIKKAYNEPNTYEADMQRHADIATRDFCWSLHKIKDHNGSVLPDDLAKDWDDHLCSKYNFLP